MGSLWRSEDMSLIELVMPRDSVHDTIEALGREGVVQFNDLYEGEEEDSNVFQRPCANQVKRCDELERKLRFFESEIRKSDISLDTLPLSDDTLYEYRRPLEELDETFSNYEKELIDLNKRLDRLLDQKTEKEELKYVLRQGEFFFKEGGTAAQDASSSAATSATDHQDHETISGSSGDRLLEGHSDRADASRSGLLYLAGVIPRDKITTFMLLVYRASRGLTIPRFVEIDEPLYDSATGNYIQKNVFIISFNAASLTPKLENLCKSSGARLHRIPSQPIDMAKSQVDQEISEHQKVIDRSENRRHDVLSDISTYLLLWKRYVFKEKSIYHTQNLFDYTDKTVRAQGWCPKKLKTRVEELVDRATQTSQTDVPTSLREIPAGKQVPPTHFELNRFTDGFQLIINAYGVPRYQEINPAVFATITFPFLFAIMFGDYGHALIMLGFALVLVLGESKLKKLAETSEMFGMVFQGRYIVLFMALFSVYTGLLYNDMFSLSFDWFGSAYSFDESTGVGSKVGRTYPFGVDPAWYGTQNKLTFYNSLKMKMSIVFGVSHMLLGIGMSCANHIKFKHYSHIVFEFIPEVLILTCTFGYLSFMIVYKWCNDWFGDNRQPPSLLSTMTDFFLHPWGLQQPPLFTGQLPIQMVFFLIAVLCVPVLLFPVPCMKIFSHMKNKKKEVREEIPLNQSYHHEDIIEEDLDVNNLEEAGVTGANEGEEEEFSASEVFIQQLIHTIEFVLGAVSNTASYLRLWALSLAHAQLSEVFWSMTVGLALTYPMPNRAIEILLVNCGVGIFVTYIVWFLATVGVLLCMESLSAFLHTIRLHWVESMNKHFAGDGVKFEPFSLTPPPASAEQ